VSEVKDIFYVDCEAVKLLANHTRMIVVELGQLQISTHKYLPQLAKAGL
jgi:hypothetical protein